MSTPSSRVATPVDRSLQSIGEVLGRVTESESREVDLRLDLGIELLPEPRSHRTVTTTSVVPPPVKSQPAWKSVPVPYFQVPSASEPPLRLLVLLFLRLFLLLAGVLFLALFLVFPAAFVAHRDSPRVPLSACASARELPELKGVSHRMARVTSAARTGLPQTLGFQPSRRLPAPTPSPPDRGRAGLDSEGGRAGSDLPHQRMGVRRARLLPVRGSSERDRGTTRRDYRVTLQGS